MVTAASALPTPSASLALGRARTSRAASASPRCAARQTPPPPPTTTPSWRVASSSRAVTTRTGARGGEASCSASYRTLPSRRERGGRGRGRHRGGGGGGATRVASAASATKRASATPQTIARSDGSPSSSSSSRLERPVGNSSTAQAMANSVNILLGVGLLSVPYALQQGGWAGLGVLSLLGAMTNYTGKALIKCQAAGSLPVVDVAGFESDLSAGGAVASARGMGASGDEYDLMEMDAGDATSGGPGYCEYPRRRPLLSYEDIGEAAFGPRGRDFITFVLYTELIGTGALFFILEGDHLAILFDHAHDETWYMAAAAAVMIPTLWLFDLSSLSAIGALGAAASMSLVGVVLYELVAVGGYPANPPPGFDTTALVHLSTLPVSFGLLAFVFAGHAVFPAIYTSMEKPEEYPAMLDKTYVIVGLTCLVIGSAGYALYGDQVMDEVTLNLPAGVASTIALALITVNPFSKFALTMDPVARGLEKGLLGIDVASETNRSTTASALKARGLRTGLGLSALATAATVPFFAVFMSLIGSFLTLTVSVIFPSACYLKMFEDEVTDGERALNWGIMVLGGFCVVAGSVSAVQGIAGEIGF